VLFRSIMFPSNNVPYDDKNVMEIHTLLKLEELVQARLRLDNIGDNNDPLNVVI